MALMKTDSRHTEEVDRLGFLLHEDSRLMRTRFEKLGSRDGLSSAQGRLLVVYCRE